MSDLMNKIKGHPAFLAFGCSNVKINDDENTQSARDNIQREKDEQIDNGVKQEGGEEGRA